MTRSASTVTRVRRILKDARDSGRSGPEFEALALIAEKLAQVAESAPIDSPRHLAALRELRATLGALFASGAAGERRGAAADAGASGSGAGDVERELAELMGAGPSRLDS